MSSFSASTSQKSCLPYSTALSMTLADIVCAFSFPSFGQPCTAPSFYDFATCKKKIKTSRKIARTSTPTIVCQADAAVKNEVILSIDIGTSFAKAALVNVRTGDLLTSVFSNGYKVHSEKSFHMTQKKQDWYRSMVMVAKNALQCRESGDTLKAIAVTGQMQNLLATGSHLPSLLEENIILYSDSRAVSNAERLSEVAGEEIQPTSLLAKLTLLPPPEIHGHNPQYRLLFGAADYAISRLTDGSPLFLTDPTTLSTTGLSKPPHREYNAKLLTRTGLHSFIPLFPAVQKSLQVCGKVSKQAAHALGFPMLAGTPLIHAGGDAATASFGAGCVTANEADYLYTGTSGWFGRVERNDTLSMENNSSSGLFYLAHPHSEDDSLVLASLASAGANFTYAASVLLGGIDVEELNRLALSAPTGANGVAYIPYLSGRRCPRPNARATGGLCGLTTSTTRADIARAVVEGVVFAFKACYSELHSADGIIHMDNRALRVVGGGARSTAFLDALANTFSRPVVQGPVGDVGIRGAAFAAILALGALEQCEHWSGRHTDFNAVSCAPGVAKQEWSAAWEHWLSHANNMERTWG